MKAIYDVVVWYKTATTHLGLPDRVISHVGRKQDEEMMSSALGELHWNFGTLSAAIRYAESLFEFATSDDIVLPAVGSRGDNNFERKVYKDTRQE